MIWSQEGAGPLDGLSRQAGLLTFCHGKHCGVLSLLAAKLMHCRQQQQGRTCLCSVCTGGRITAGVGANLIGQHASDRNQEATVYVGGLDPQARLITTLLTHTTFTFMSKAQQHAICYACASFLPSAWQSSAHPASPCLLKPSCAAVCSSTQPLSSLLGALQMTEELVWELFVQAGPVGERPASRRAQLQGGLRCNVPSTACPQHKLPQ